MGLFARLCWLSKETNISIEIVLYLGNRAWASFVVTIDGKLRFLGFRVFQSTALWRRLTYIPLSLEKGSKICE